MSSPVVVLARNSSCAPWFVLPLCSSFITRNLVFFQIAIVPLIDLLVDC
jgi:hypothetical protein